MKDIDLSSNRMCAEVSYFKSPNKFWIRLEQHKSVYNDMISRLQNDYRNAYEDSNLSVKTLTLGSIYCTFNQKAFEWQRCEILLVNKSDASIFYTDTGSSDLVPIKTIKVLKDGYKTINRFAIPCSLSNIMPNESTSWSTNALNIFYKLVMGKTLTVTFKSKSINVYNVDMYLKNSNIADELVKENVAVYLNENNDTANNQNDSDVIGKRVTANPPMSSPVKIHVTCIYSPFCFYAQLDDILAQYQEFEEKMQTFYTSNYQTSKVRPLKRPQVGQLCIAKFTEDEAWYRALIKEIDPETNNIRVFFVDYGNEDIVKSGNDLLMIDEEFKLHPQIAIKCCLNGIKPLSESFSNISQNEIVDFMYDSLSDNITAKFVGKVADDFYMVDLTVDGEKKVDIAQLLVDKQYVSRDENLLLSRRPNRYEVNGKQLGESKALRPKSENIVEPNAPYQQKFKSYSSNEPVLEENKKYQFRITNVETVFEFYAQTCSTVSDFSELNTMLTDMQYFYEKKVNLPQPLYELNNACVYYDSERKLWYRAQIVHIIDSNHCIVNLVDQGLTKIVNKASLRDIYEKYLHLGGQSILASLYDLDDLGIDNVDEQVHSKFQEIVLNKTFFGKVMKITKAIQGEVKPETKLFKVNKYLLNLFDDDGESVYSILTQEFNNSTDLIVDKFKPTVRSKLEETMMPNLNDTTMNASMNSKLDEFNRPQAKLINREIQKENYPFPIHKENAQFNLQEQSAVRISTTSTTRTLSIERETEMENMKSEEKIVIQTVVQSAVESQSPAIELKSPSIYFYDSIDLHVEPNKPYQLSFCFYESLNSFFAQLNEHFIEFEGLNDEFQYMCQKQNRITLNELKNLKNLEHLAIGAKFYDDESWYRARIIDVADLVAKMSQSQSGDDTQVNLEFIDYGNAQMTAIKDCVFLNEKFAKYKRCSLKINGIMYLDKMIQSGNNKLTKETIENILFYGLIPEEFEDVPFKFEWNDVVFVQQAENQLFMESDDFYKLIYQLGLVDLNYYINPIDTKENILSQANHSEINKKMTENFKAGSQTSLNSVIYDALVANLDLGLKYIYFVLSNSLATQKQIESELNANIKTEMIKLTYAHLSSNRYYLLDYEKKLHRVLLLAKSNGSCVFHSIDCGQKFTIDEQSLDVYLMTPKYYKFNSLALHCRSTMASAIEKVWTHEERSKFFNQIKPNTTYKIRILSSYEPYIFEFVDDKQKIDFQFNSIISRINQNSLEPQVVLCGNSSVSLSEEFFLAGNFLVRNQSKLNVFNGFYEQKQPKIYLLSHRLLDQLQAYSKNLTQYINSLAKSGNEVNVLNLKRDDLVLARPKSTHFFNSLSSNVKELIQNSWSRVQIKSILRTNDATNERVMTLEYCDYGIEDYLILPNANQTGLDKYEFMALPTQYRIWPLFVFECTLDNQKVSEKSNKITDRNPFVDYNYLNETLNSLRENFSTLYFQIDLTASFLQLNKNDLYVCDIIEKKTRKSFEDLVIENALDMIKNYKFTCIVTHVISINDFYVQLCDAKHEELLNKLHDKIEVFFKENRLKTPKKLELNQFCLAFYEDDGQFYRAQIKKLSGQEVDVFYIDFGNSGKLKQDQLREIPSEFVQNLPKSFVINCDYKLNLDEKEYEDLSEYFLDIFADLKFELKYVQAKKVNDVNLPIKFEVELYDFETKKSIFELFLADRITKQMSIQNQSTVQIDRLERDLSDSSGDDRALAESITRVDDTLANNTLGNNTYAAFNATDVEPGVKNQYEANYDSSWCDTPLHLKNYNYNYESTINTTYNNESVAQSKYEGEDTNSDEHDLTMTEKLSKDDDLYSTANDSVQFADKTENQDTEPTLPDLRFDSTTSTDGNSRQRDQEERCVLENCLISFMHSTESFYIQQADVEEQISKIQPEIDDCLDPYEPSKTDLCISQFKQDELFYRSKLLKYEPDADESFVLFIDYGNKEKVLNDTITAMSDNLMKTAPLAINCKLDFKLSLSSKAYGLLENLINMDTLFDVSINKKDLSTFQTSCRTNEEAFEVKLTISKNKREIDEKVLNEKDVNSIFDEPTNKQRGSKESTPEQERSVINLENISKVASTENLASKVDIASNENEKERFGMNDPRVTHFDQQNQFKVKCEALNHSPDNLEDELDKSLLELMNKDENLVQPTQLEDFFYKPEQLSHDQSAELSFRNKTVSAFHDENTVWQSKDNVDSSLYEVKKLAENVTVDNFADQDSRWSVVDESTIADKQNQSVKSQLETSKNNVRNMTVDEFADQDSRWSVQDELENIKNDTKSQFNDQSYQSSVNGNYNMTISRFLDQNSDWTKNESTMNNTEIENSYMEKQTQTSLDNKADWSRNEFGQELAKEDFIKDLNQSSKYSKDLSATYLNDTTKSIVLNQTVSQFPDQSSNWTIHEKPNRSDFDLSKTLNESQSVQDANLTTSRDYFSKTIDENNMSVWNSDPNRSIIDIRKQKEDAKFLNGYLVQAYSLNNFFIQLSDADNELMNMKTLLDDLDKNFEKMPSVGSMCVAKYHVDKQYYRAQIVEVPTANLNKSNLNTSLIKADLKLKVFFVDYGNEDYVSFGDIYKMSYQLKDIPNQAIRCQLNFTLELKAIVHKLNDLEMFNLIKEFKNLTGKNILKIKTKEKHTPFRQQPIAVDIFINEVNICDHLLSYLLKQDIQEQYFKIKEEKLFDGYIIDLIKYTDKNPFLKLKIQNESVLGLVDKSIDETIMNMNGQHCLSLLPKEIVDNYNLRNKYGRVKVLENEKNGLIRCEFVDYSYETTLKPNEIVKINNSLSVIKPAIEEFNLNLVNASELGRLSSQNIEHLHLILVGLLDFKPESDMRKPLKKFKIVLFNQVSKFISKMDEPISNLHSIRIYDTNRENLDINTIIESCISLMSRPFTGHLAHLENDFSWFDCLHESSQAFVKEFQKLYVYSFENSTGSSLRVGDLCLYDKTQRKQLSSSDSIFSLSEHQIDTDTTQLSGELDRKEICRGVILDEGEGKCVVMNVDTGSKLTLSKRRLGGFNDNVCKYLPFMVIRAKTEKEIKDTNIKRILHKSRYYGEKIKLNVKGSWKLTIKPNNQHCFQTEQDLYKIVELVGDDMESLDNTTAEIESNLNQFKRKRSEEFDELFSRKNTIHNMKFKSTMFYYLLSYAKSLSCFYIHTSESAKLLKSIEDQIKFDYESKLKVDSTQNVIYGLQKENKFFRVRIVDQLNNESCLAFFIDYGFVEKVLNKTLFALSDMVQQLAPQAICCKLHGFENVNDQTYLHEVLHLLKKLLNDKPFMATIFKRFNVNNCIENCVPLQVDNTKPIEIVIHLFNDEELVNEDLDKSSIVVNEINTEKKEELRNVTVILKSLMTKLKETKRKVALNLPKHVEIPVRLAFMKSPNQFFLYRSNYMSVLNELNKKLELNYGSNQVKCLPEKEIKKGSLCAYVVQSESIFNRALIIDSTRKKNQKLFVFIYRIDTGQYIEVISDHLYPLYDDFYKYEPLCFECTLGIQIRRDLDELIKNKFLSLLGSSNNPLKIKLVEELKPLIYEENIELDLKRYLVTLYTNDNVDICVELKNFIGSLAETPNKASKAPTLCLNDKTLVDETEKVESSFCFKESKLELNKHHIIQLTVVDTAKHFGIVLCSDLSKRHQFLNYVHQSHKENRKNLKLISSILSNDEIVGKPCVVNSLQISKWTRGLVISYDTSNQMCRVYLVDYCKTVCVRIDRIYALENEVFLNMPSYVHRCQLVDDPYQLELFEKYLDLIKSNSNTSISRLSPPGNSEDDMFNGDMFNSSHISVENIEILIECLDKQLTPLNAENEFIKNYQYTIKVLDFKRIRPPQLSSPYGQLKRTAQQLNIDSLTNNSATLLENRDHDLSTEIILCSTYKDNYINITSNQVLSYSSSNPAKNSCVNQNENDQHNTQDNENEATFSAITESTRIQQQSDINQTDDDLTQINERDSDYSLTSKYKLNGNKNRFYNRREETSNWIKDLDENESSQCLLSQINDLVPNGPKIRVRIMPNSFSPSDFICQKLELLGKYDRLLNAMNEYYEKLSNASKSLEKDSKLSTKYSDTIGYNDSLGSEDGDPFAQTFKVGNYCAALLGKQWVRCVIIDIASNSAQIECVDDGRSLRMPLNKLENLIDQFKMLPRVAFKCKLALDSTKLLTFNLDAINKFKEMITQINKEFMVEILAEYEEDFYKLFEVNLYHNDINVIDLLKA